MKYKLLFCILGISACLQAQIPAGYYNNAVNKKGHNLRVALHYIIDDHNAISYSGLWDAFKTTDKRSNGKVWDIYSDIPGGTPEYYFTFGSDQCGNYNSEGDCYNREHSIPKSWFGDQHPMYTDLFHLYPTDGYVNNRRGNLPFSEVNNPSWTSTNGCKLGNSSVSGCSGSAFEPIDEYKGDLARSYFYMTVRYMDKNLGQVPQSMFNRGSLKPWALDMLIDWHNQDPVSQKEIDRNNAIYGIQHNRNPFIDYPELVGKIYGSDSVNAFLPNAIAELEQLSNWQIYPNPATDQIHIVPSNEPDEPLYISILNLAGQKIKQERHEGESRYNINVSDLPTGLYLLQIHSNSFIINKKISIVQ